MITLTHDLESIHADLEQRLALAATARPDSAHARGHYSAIDTFLSVASRHNAGMLEAIEPLVRQVRGRGTLADQYVVASRHYEEALAQVKARLYGSTYATHQPWSDIWTEVRRELDAVCQLELRFASILPSDARNEAGEDHGTQLHHAELVAPTRPHPFIPHQGLAGHVARRIARRVDQFWDTAEGRMIPTPVRHHDREHQGRLTQYLLADPHLQKVGAHPVRGEGPAPHRPRHRRRWTSPGGHERRAAQDEHESPGWPDLR